MAAALAGLCLDGAKACTFPSPAPACQIIGLLSINHRRHGILVVRMALKNGFESECGGSWPIHVSLGDALNLDDFLSMPS